MNLMTLLTMLAFTAGCLVGAAAVTAAKSAAIIIPAAIAALVAIYLFTRKKRKSA